MVNKPYALPLLFLTFILISCSNPILKSEYFFSNNVNFSERIILAALDNKTKASGFSEKDRLSTFVKPSCVFDGASHDSMDISYNKFKAKLKGGVNKSTPLTDKQMEDAFELLKTGQVKGDIKQTILALLRGVIDFPGQELTDIPNIFGYPSDLSKFPGVNTAGKTAKIFIKPDNRTFRLAILAYARMNGVNIEEKNLDDLYSYLEKGRESDFNKLVEGGLISMKNQYGLTDIETAAQKFHSIGQACMGKAR